MHYCTQLMRLQVKSHHLIPGKKWKIYIFNITYMYAKYLNYLPYHSWFLLEQHNLVLFVIWVIPCFFIFRIRQYNAMFKLCGVCSALFVLSYLFFFLNLTFFPSICNCDFGTMNVFCHLRFLNNAWHRCRLLLYSLTSAFIGLLFLQVHFALKGISNWMLYQFSFYQIYVNQ